MGQQVTVLVPARPCPPVILARTRNAKASLRKAEEGAWITFCTYAVGGSDDLVQSILLRVQRGPVAMTACWSGAVGAFDKYGNPAGLGFDGAWRRDEGALRRINYTQLAHYLVDPSTEPPTPAKLKENAEDQGTMLEAIGASVDWLGASFVRLHDTVDFCSSHVPGAPPLGKQLCTNAALPGLPYCPGPCQR